MWHFSWKFSHDVQWHVLTFATIDRVTSLMSNLHNAHKENVKFKISWREA